jgi:rubredoxin-NAD+ reductase
MHTVIIGSGIAGWTIARELRRLQPDADQHPITLICAGPGDFYSKPMLSNALASGKTPATLVMTAAAKIAEQTKTRLLDNTRVASIDRAERIVRTDGGDIRYEQLVLGLGADPINLPLTGGAVGDVLSVNDLTDYARFRELLAAGAPVTILGAGLIGCEFANDLASAGHPVRVYDIAQWPLGRLLPEQAGRYSQEKLAAAGIQFEFGKSVTQVDREGDGYRLTDTTGQTHQAALVLSAVGLRPRTDLAKAAGLECGRGIRIDAFGRTSDPHIYALGDCAEYGQAGLLPYIQPVMNSGRAMAATLAGQATAIKLPSMPVLVKTPACPTVIAPPAATAAGNWMCEPVEGGLRALFKDADGALLGMALLGSATAQRAELAPQLPALLG